MAIMTPSSDRTLTWWSRALWLMALVTLLYNLAEITLIWFDLDLSLSLEREDETWEADFHTLPFGVKFGLGAILVVPELPWFYAIVQIALLGHSFMRGQIFTEINCRRFQKIGLALIIEGALESLVDPSAMWLLYLTDTTPWLAEFDPFFTWDLNPLMAGLLFFVLGKIMQRGLELDTSDRFTI